MPFRWGSEVKNLTPQPIGRKPENLLVAIRHMNALASQLQANREHLRRLERERERDDDEHTSRGPR